MAVQRAAPPSLDELHLTTRASNGRPPRRQLLSIETAPPSRTPSWQRTCPSSEHLARCSQRRPSPLHQTRLQVCGVRPTAQSRPDGAHAYVLSRTATAPSCASTRRRRSRGSAPIEVSASVQRRPRGGPSAWPATQQQAAMVERGAFQRRRSLRLAQTQTSQAPHRHGASWRAVTAWRTSRRSGSATSASSPTLITARAAHP